jgi:hypothetical protein
VEDVALGVLQDLVDPPSRFATQDQQGRVARLLPRLSVGPRREYRKRDQALLLALSVFPAGLRLPDPG